VGLDEKRGGPKRRGIAKLSFFMAGGKAIKGGKKKKGPLLIASCVRGEKGAFGGGGGEGPLPTPLFRTSRRGKKREKFGRREGGTCFLS